MTLLPEGTVLKISQQMNAETIRDLEINPEAVVGSIDFTSMYRRPRQRPSWDTETRVLSLTPETAEIDVTLKMTLRSPRSGEDALTFTDRKVGEPMNTLTPIGACTDPNCSHAPQSPVAQEWELIRHAEKQGVDWRDAWNYFADQGYDMSQVPDSFGGPPVVS